LKDAGTRNISPIAIIKQDEKLKGVSEKGKRRGCLSPKFLDPTPGAALY